MPSPISWQTADGSTVILADPDALIWVENLPEGWPAGEGDPDNPEPDEEDDD